MPTVKRAGPYRFFFYSNERGEPPQIHVQRDGSLAKFWLAPVALGKLCTRSAWAPAKSRFPRGSSDYSRSKRVLQSFPSIVDCVLEP